jgi:hypothetical protein
VAQLKLDGARIPVNRIIPLYTHSQNINYTHSFGWKGGGGGKRSSESTYRSVDITTIVLGHQPFLFL